MNAIDTIATVFAQPQVVTIGASLMDLFVSSSEFSLAPSQKGTLLCQKYGDKIDVDQFLLAAGGGACNTAVGFVRQGYATAVVSEVGKDILAEQIEKTLYTEGVSTQYLSRERREETGMSVVLVAPQGGRTVLIHRGASSFLEEADVDWKVVTSADWVHVTNVAGQLPLLQRLFTVGQQNSVSVSWNPGKADLRAVVERRLVVVPEAIAVLFVNQEEWDILLPVRDQIQAAIPLIIVTNGTQGGIVIHHGQHVHTYQVTPVQVVDETGAGDAFAVGFVSAHRRGVDITAACDYAKQNAASVVGQLGAQAGLLRQG